MTRDDLQQLAARGITPEDAETQLRRLEAGQPWARLVRPCTPGDGLLPLPDEARAGLERRYAEAAAAGRITRFVPASGAATRMFADLAGDAARVRLRENLVAFAFREDLEKTMADEGLSLAATCHAGDDETLVRYLLDPCGLGYAHLPKGLLAFHAAVDGARTPFIEHLAEAALANGLDGTVHLHFTVSPEHRPLFQAQLAAWRPTLEQTYGCRYEVAFSVQDPATDTLALDGDAPLRDGDGRLVLRPGGHGALLANLAGLGADIVLVRNIDNVLPDAHKAANLDTARLLAGTLLTVQQELHALLRALRDNPRDPLARELTFTFLIDRLQQDVPLDASPQQLLDALDRPLRVCGMVPNSGEPGGGPFWVRGADGRISRQIVEGAQIDTADPEQAAIVAASTHFNPVDMACALCDERGRPYDLRRFVDPDAVIVTSKVQDGRSVRVLERPGLWNGAMAGWHTLFVEIPAAAFNPVKTVFDLLRPAHQP